MVQKYPTPVEIAKKYDFGDADDVLRAAEEMKGVPDHELHECIAGVKLRPEWARAAGLSHAENYRRASKDAENATVKDRWWNASIGLGVAAIAAIAAAIVGALFTAWLKG